jgi:hypothetical protein
MYLLIRQEKSLVSAKKGIKKCTQQNKTGTPTAISL